MKDIIKFILILASPFIFFGAILCALRLSFGYWPGQDDPSVESWEIGCESSGGVPTLAGCLDKASFVKFTK